MLTNNPWTYITFSELMSSVKQDLKSFDDAGLIDEDGLIKIVEQCNSSLGDRIHPTKNVLINIENFKGECPTDFYKIRAAYNIETIVAYGNPILHTTKIVYDDVEPENCSDIIEVQLNDCKNLVYVSRLNSNTGATEQHSYTIGQRLKLGSRFKQNCIEGYANSQQDVFEIDLVNNELETGIRRGKIFFTYLSKLEKEGETLVPFHALLTPYYEYSIKERILENIMLNSDADVAQKLQFVISKKIPTYAVAHNFVNSPEVDQWHNIKKERQDKYYEKWYKAYEV